MKAFKLYKIEDRYIRFLHSRDHKVQYNKDAKRPYVGVVFAFRKYNYFVPMESPKPSHVKIKAGKHILRIANGKYGLLGFNNMIPVPDEALIMFDISSEKDDNYRILLERQVAAINKMKADVLDHAQRTYFDVVEHNNKFLVSISCDFRKMEKTCKEYKQDYRK